MIRTSPSRDEVTAATNLRLRALAAAPAEGAEPAPGTPPAPELRAVRDVVPDVVPDVVLVRPVGLHAAAGRGPLRLRARARAAELVAGRVPVFSPVQVGAIVCLLAVLVLFVAWQAWQAAPREQTVAQVTPLVTGTPLPVSGAAATAAGSAGPGPPAAVATGAPVGEPGATVVVDVAGKVRRPGVATLPAGSRVIDALQRAGGARAGVDLTSLNLARLLVDGEQILVGVPRPSGATPAAGAPAGDGTPGLVSLTAASLDQLESLPGIGPVTAQKILDWRTAHGAFTSVDELLEVDGIGDKTLAEIAPHVTP